MIFLTKGSEPLTVERTIVITHGNAEAGGIDVSMTPEEKATGEWNEETVQDAVKNELGIGSNDVPALTDTPTYRVAHPEKPDPGGSHEVSTPDIFAKSSSIELRGPEEVVSKAKPTTNPKSIITCRGIIGIMMVFRHRRYLPHLYSLRTMAPTSAMTAMTELKKQVQMILGTGIAAERSTVKTNIGHMMNLLPRQSGSQL